MLAQNVATRRQDGLIEVDVADAQVVAVRDLIVNDAGVFKRASDLADQGTEALNQAMAARLFVGVSEHAKTAAQTEIDKIAVNASFDAEHEFNCVSEVHAIGDFLAIDEASSGTALEAQKLVKTTDRAAAIFECVRADTTASTTVLVRRLRQDPDHRLQSRTLAMAGDLTLTALSPRVLFLDPGAARKVLLPPEAGMAGAVIFIANEANAAEDITVNEDADATTIVTISQNECAFLACDGTSWRGFIGAKT